MRELRHAFLDIRRQIAEVIDHRTHDRMGELMRQRPIEITARSTATRAVDIIRTEIAVVRHVDRQGERSGFAAGISAVSHVGEGSTVRFAFEFQRDSLGAVIDVCIAERILIAIGISDKLECIFRPPRFEPAHDRLLIVRQTCKRRIARECNGDVADGERIAAETRIEIAALGDD